MNTSEINSSDQLVAYLPDSRKKSISEVMESMHRSEIRNENHHNEKREKHRESFENWVPIIIPVDPDLKLFSNSTSVCVFLRGRNISTTGMSLVGSPKLEPVAMTDDTPLLRLTQLLRPHDLCSVGLAFSEGSNFTWLIAEIIREHCTVNDLTELGLRFLSRLPADHSIYKDAEQFFQLLRDNEEK